MRALLDVNVLIALLDAAHVHHSLAARWLSAEIKHGWASCPITQLGCIRILSQPAYPNSQPAAQVAARLAEATRGRHHEFWGAGLDALQVRTFHWTAVLSARHVTDVYLLALAVTRGARFVTFDRHIPVDAVDGMARQHLCVLE
jgi:toxin-antitoxin system PIN domain toxin